MTHAGLWLLPFALLAGCSDSSSSSDPPQLDASSDAAPEASPDAGLDSAVEADAALPCPVESCTFGPLELWSQPIDDYINAAAAGLSVDPMDLHRSIDDLMVFEDRLYFGYGDATLNAGRVVDIQVRYFASPGNPTPLVDFAKTTEEEVEHFRKFGDKLYIPGVDATEDAFLGNVFVRPKGGEWIRHRSVQGGVHVHDVAEFKGALYACGSGALDLETWNTNKIHSFLWKSVDGGATWETAAEVPNEQVGDRRFVQLAPLPEQLLVFGYSSTGNSITKLLSHTWDGTALTDNTLASKHFVIATELADDSTAVLRAVNASTDPLIHEVLAIVAGSSAPKVVAGLTGKVVLDIHVYEPGKAVLVVGETDKYPSDPDPTPWHVLQTSDWVEFKELASSTYPYWPTSVALWQGGLYVGTQDGKIFRSVPAQ